jgi:hypothetical protein
MYTYLASDLFDLEIRGNFPLNCSFNPKNTPIELKSPGVYMLFYRQELVFVGLAIAEQAIVRFEKQLSTITLRGTRVSFNNGTLDPNSISQTFQNSFSTAIYQNRIVFETSKKRIEYASKNWNDFSKLDDKDLSHFVFVWFPESMINGKTIEQFRNDLRIKLQPLCNG